MRRRHNADTAALLRRELLCKAGFIQFDPLTRRCDKHTGAQETCRLMPVIEIVHGIRPRNEEQLRIPELLAQCRNGIDCIGRSFSSQLNVRHGE